MTNEWLATLWQHYNILGSLAALALMMRLLASISFTPYVMYRVVLGLILLIYAYS